MSSACGLGRGFSLEAVNQSLGVKAWSGVLGTTSRKDDKKGMIFTHASVFSTRSATSGALHPPEVAGSSRNWWPGRQLTPIGEWGIKTMRSATSHP